LTRFLPILLLLLAAPAWAGERVTVTVTRVVDGDTIHVTMPDGATERVRVSAVNAPEHEDPCFFEAREFARAMLEGQTVTLDPQGRDRFGRLLAYVLVGEDPQIKSLGLELVRAGLAVIYTTRYRAKNATTYKRYQLAQMEAMAAGRCVYRSPRMIKTTPPD